MADSSESAKVTVTVVGMTDVGQVRDHNEDNFLVLDRGSGRKLANGEQMTLDLTDALVMAVCDGMGGAAAGEVASQMAVDRAVKDLGGADYSSATPDQVMVLLEAAVQNANTDILKEAEKNTEKKGMGTTMTAGVAVPGQICIAQVGDSRGYLLRSGQLVQLTKDQSLIGQLIEEGTLTEEEAEALGGRNIVLQAVGVEEQLKVDTRPFDIRRGDLILMCSDGLNGMIKDKEMEAIVNASVDDLPTAAKNLIKAANDNGGKDNITVALARFDGEGLKPPLATFSADDVDRGEGVFKTPDAVEVPNPMKKVGLVLAAIILAIIALFFFARRTTVDLPLVSSTDADVQVVLTDEEGNSIRELTVTGGRAEILGLDTGKYVLNAKADKHFDRKIELDLQNPGKAGTQDVSLIPKPATVTISSATPHVRVSILQEGDAKPLKELDLERAGSEQKESVPGGREVHFKASRAGFAEVTKTLVTEPEGEHEVRFEELAALKAVLPVRVDEDGVEVKLFDDEYGERIRTWRSTKKDEQAELEGRPGKIRIEARKPGFEAFFKVVRLVEGMNPLVEIDMRLSKVPVVFVASRTLRVRVMLEDPATGNVRHEKTVFVGKEGDVFRSVAERLEPGRYRADYKDKDGNAVSVSFTVEVGAKDKTVELTR